MTDTIKLTDNNGHISYCLANGYLHRANGPAWIRTGGNHLWYLFGNMHRYYGPRCCWDSWWIHGEFVK